MSLFGTKLGIIILSIEKENENRQLGKGFVHADDIVLRERVHTVKKTQKI